MSAYIYSLRITCDGNSVDKLRNDSLGYYPDYYDSSNPVVILLSDSNLTSGTSDNTTIVDGYLASRYKPLLMDVGDIHSTFDTDNPIVNISEVSMSIWNGSKTLLYYKSQGTDLQDQNATLSLNVYDDNGVLVSSTPKIAGKITSVNFDETKIYLTLSNSKYNRIGSVLTNDDDIFTIGNTSASESHFKLQKIDTANDPCMKILSFGDLQTFRIVGVVNPNTYIIQSDINLNASMYASIYSKIQNSLLYVVNSSYDTKEQYSRISSITLVDDSILVGSLPEGYYYYQIVILDAFKNKMIEYNSVLQANVVDMYTFVQFRSINHEYKISKLTISDNITDLYYKQDDKIKAIPRSLTSASYWDLNYQVTSANTVKLLPVRYVDDTKIKTYTIVPLTGLECIPDSNLAKWQFGKYVPNTLYGAMFRRERVVDGLFKNNPTSITATQALYNPVAISDRINRYSNDTYYATASHNVQSINPSNDSVIVGLQATMPKMNDNFTFDNCYLGICCNVWSNNHITSINNESAIKILAREYGGCVNKIADIELINNGIINNIPTSYYEVFDDGGDTQLKNDWLQLTIDTDTTNGVSRFTTLEKLSLNVDNIDEYNKLEKVGLFFARTAKNGVVESTINIMEMCFIFEHEIDTSELYI